MPAPTKMTKSIARPIPKGLIWLVAAAIWAVALAAGFGALAAYQNSPGPASLRSSAWPGGTSLPLSKGVPTIVMVVHPLCPCTRASMFELSKLMADVRGRLSGYVIVVGSKVTGPAGESAAFHRAETIPGIRPIADDQGTYSRRFGAATSGQVYLYDETGRLQFSGGVTPARGHIGPNHGTAAITSFIESRHLTRVSTKVFGCLLDRRRERL